MSLPFGNPSSTPPCLPNAHCTPLLGLAMLHDQVAAGFHDQRSASEKSGQHTLALNPDRAHDWPPTGTPGQRGTAGRWLSRAHLHTGHIAPGSRSRLPTLPSPASLRGVGDPGSGPLSLFAEAALLCIKYFHGDNPREQRRRSDLPPDRQTDSCALLTGRSLVPS